MGVILLFSEIINSPDIQNKNSVLVGGSFDVLHSGHITFLRNAKKQGTTLIVLLESDTAIRQKKGVHRPISSQQERAFVLSELQSVDSIVLMPEETHDSDYYEVTKAIKPAIIATTKGDPYREQKIVCANAIQAMVIDVTPRIDKKSTSRIVKLLKK